MQAAGLLLEVVRSITYRLQARVVALAIDLLLSNYKSGSRLKHAPKIQDYGNTTSQVIRTRFNRPCCPFCLRISNQFAIFLSGENGLSIRTLLASMLSRVDMILQ
ncbi:hypothetical protein M378DRAFT_172808 [Amanita muscaria Koide BX008]|uniref:Uncharacterized protein n=1 Tax=Amanita muscaria (strain Koide BX008) TaxID=946122 RepID=A0A0C2SQV0_AMAMK|nr:hypothetical protein M378DRAFT_172808 [Amanita muscaria Koide BX008]